MRVGICDDSEQARQMVTDWLKIRDDVSERNIFNFCSGTALLEYLRLSVLDIIFLDCKMDGMDGIETAQAIRRQDSRVVIILLTDFTAYARFGYGADVLDFILKREFHLHINRIFDRAVRRINDSCLKTYSIKTGAGLIHLDISEILYIECQRRKKEVFVRSGHSYEFYGRVDDIEKDLKQYGFIRPHKGFLVNSRYVRVFMPNAIWVAGLDISLPVSRGKYKKAYDEMTVFAAETCL